LTTVLAGKKVTNGLCRECNENIGQPTTRYVMPLLLSDLSGNAYATAFDDTAKVSAHSNQ
jgi:hypothetical protein